MSTLQTPSLADRLERGLVDPAAFSHREHLRAGFELLARHGFQGALPRMTAGIKLIAAKTGNAGLYHDTITTAFLAILSERMAAHPNLDFDAFLEAHPDLMDKALLNRWYDAQLLASPLARDRFVLPRPARAAGAS